MEGRKKGNEDGPVALFAMFCVLKKKEEDLKQICKTKVHLLSSGSRWQQMLMACLPNIHALLSLGP